MDITDSAAGDCLYTLITNHAGMVVDEALKSSIQRIVNDMYPAVVTRLFAPRAGESGATLKAHAQFMTHPVSISKDIVEEVILPNAAEMVMAEKSDGVRCWLLFFTEEAVAPEGESNATAAAPTHSHSVVALTRNGNMWRVPAFDAPAEMFKGTLIDGEALPPEYDAESCAPVSTYAIFDIVEFCATRWIQRTSWSARMASAEAIARTLRCAGNVFTRKRWHPLVDYVSRFNSLDHMMGDLRMPADGWIIQSCKEMPYKTARGILAQRRSLHTTVTMSNKTRRSIDAYGTVFKLKMVHTIDLWTAYNEREEVIVACDDDRAPCTVVGSEIWRDGHTSLRLSCANGASDLADGDASASLVAFVRRQRREGNDGYLASSSSEEGGTQPPTASDVCIVEFVLSHRDDGHCTTMGDLGSVPNADGVEIVYATPLKIRTDKDVANATSTVKRTIEDSANTSARDIFERIKRLSARAR